MPNMPNHIVEGIFAIDKPRAISSGQLVRDLQHVFGRSTLFAPLLGARKSMQRHGKKPKYPKLKIGHGGTLDPMATGVMIIGIGNGTKRLQKFLECTKTYEATVLFGAATDMYDTEGQVVERAPYSHLTKHKIEDALQTFRGKIAQKPPLYSALKMDGKRLCDYAREGKQIPRQIEERTVEVKSLEIVDWLPGGSHNFRLAGGATQCPLEKAQDKVMQHTAPCSEGTLPSHTSDDARGTKRKRWTPQIDGTSNAHEEDESLAKAFSTPNLPGNQGFQNDALADSENREKSNESEVTQATHHGPPAVKLRMTVTSGFYVRSLAYDLGKAVHSLACLSALVRTRQGEHELGRNVIGFNDLSKSEGEWGPKVEQLIDIAASNETEDTVI